MSALLERAQGFEDGIECDRYAGLREAIGGPQRQNRPLFIRRQVEIAHDVGRMLERFRGMQKVAQREIILIFWGRFHGYPAGIRAAHRRPNNLSSSQESSPPESLGRFAG